MKVRGSRGVIARNRPVEADQPAGRAAPLDSFQKLFAIPRATRRVTYVEVKQAFEKQGLATEWRAMMDRLPARDRDALLQGQLNQREALALWTKDRASWRASTGPISLDVLRAELVVEGRAAELERALRVMTPGQRGRLEAGVMKAPEIDAVLQDAKSREADVIIVGAGMAGLAAAQDLMKQGLSVVVLEAGDVVGGRLHDGSIGGARFDAGAAWIHATDENPLTPLIKQRGFTLVAHDAPLLGYGGRGTPEQQGEQVADAIEHVQDALENAAEHGRDVAADTLTAGDKQPWLRHATNTVGPLTMGVDIQNVSTLDAGSAPAEEHGASSDHTPDQFIEEGWQAVVTSFAHGVPVRLQTPVQKVSWGKDGVVVDAGGVKYSGKKIVMTTSTGVLASGKIAFDPPLPAWKNEAIRNVPMATFDKIAVRFDKDIFTSKGTKAGAFVYELDDKNPMDVLVRPMGKDVVIALVGGTYADKLHAQGERVMVDALLDKLERIYGADVRDHVVASAVTNWRANPWQLGSFTAARPGYARAREKLKLPVNDAIFFAGEATSLRWNGMAPGAWLTGREAAQNVTNVLGRERLARAKAKLRVSLAAPSPQQAAASP